MILRQIRKIRKSEMITRRIDIDFSHTTGKIKPVNGVLGMPIYNDSLGFSLNDVYRDLGVGAVLFSAREGEGCIPIDLDRVFPDPSLDERFFSSYNFEELDRALADVRSIGAEIVLRLGITPLPIGKRAYLRIPMSEERIAYVFNRIIAHCNTGFAGGFKLSVKRVEIWQSADRDIGLFGSSEEYFSLYRTVALKTREDFPRIKIGAYSSGGFASLNHVGLGDEEKNYVSYFEDFLSYLKKNGDVPLDFFTWKCDPETPEELSLHANYARSYLNHYGFKKTESIISSFSPIAGEKYSEYREKSYPALLASCLISAVKSDVSMMFYSETHPQSGRNALYSLDDRRKVHTYASYNVMRAFGKLIKGASSVETSEDYRREIYSLATVTPDSGYVIVVTRNFDGVLELIPSSHGYTSYSIEGVLGGGERGEGFTTKAEGIPFGNTIKLRVGKDEVYVLTLR